MKRNEDLIKGWIESAPFWEKYHAALNAMFVPVTQSLIHDGIAGVAGQLAGQAILDVATGPGEPALTLAGLVGPKGSVVGVDPVPAMVEAARREAARRQLANVRFEVAFADRLPFPDDTFDAVLSRFGVMFFPAPLEGIREMLRVLRSGGGIAAAVWGSADRNPFHYIFSRAIDRYIKSPPPEPGAPDAFRFAEPGELLAIFKVAGAVDTSDRILQFQIQTSIAVEDFWTMRCEISEKFREKLTMLTKEQATEVRREVITAARTYSANDQLRFPAEIRVVSGRKL